MKRLLLAALLLAAIIVPSAGWALRAHYLSPAGTLPPSLTGAGSPTAICSDGSRSYSPRRQGTCLDHGGVALWQLQPAN
jgi:hypothetical protein